MKELCGRLRYDIKLFSPPLSIWWIYVQNFLSVAGRFK